MECDTYWDFHLTKVQIKLSPKRRIRRVVIRLMDKSAIHTNLSTSFVNLGALIRHLRRLQFFGSIKVELTAAEGDIIFARNGRLHAVQFDHVSGEISEGRAALRSLLLRCREPNGRIHVYRSSGREAATDTYIDEAIMVRARRMASNHT